MGVNFNKLLSVFKLQSAIITFTTILAAGIFINAFNNITSAQTKKDSTEVLTLVEKYQSVWNTHNVAALGLFFSEDADFIMGNLPLINGREGIQNWWQNYFKRQEPERKLMIDVISLSHCQRGC